MKQKPENTEIVKKKSEAGGPPAPERVGVGHPENPQMWTSYNELCGRSFREFGRCFWPHVLTIVITPKWGGKAPDPTILDKVSDKVWDKVA
jgi:hypothetical protein